MKTYANQRVVTVHKAEADKTHTYVTINKECLMRALSNLTLNELKVYLYLASNQNNFKLALSPEDIALRTNANKRNIQTAVDNLIDKGYLNFQGGNQYIFNEKPLPEEEKTSAQNAHIECINNSHPMSKTLIGDAQNTHSNMSKKHIEIIHNNTIYNTSYNINDEEEDFLKKLLSAMDCNQLVELQEMCSNGVPYKEIANRYSIPYFDAKHFRDIYDDTYQAQYNKEHAEEIAKRKEIEKQLWLQEQQERDLYKPIVEGAFVANRMRVKQCQQLFEEVYQTQKNYEDDAGDCASMKLLAELTGDSSSSDIDLW